MSNRSPSLSSCPDWWRGAVIYQIYPRSFADSDGDGVGDLKGILGRLDYVASLGVDGIWLSPFFTSPMKDFGYDVSDYRGVDPLFGTLADFDAVLARAHQLGLKVIVDQVWSHTSNEHPWFIESAASRDSPKVDWYVWADAKADGSPPNNWQAVFGGPSWTWNARRRQYYLHNFLIEQPDLNYWNPAVQDAILETGRFWLERGVDGFRLDVINFIFHDQTLRDNPIAPHASPPALPTRFQRHVHDRSRPEALAFLGRLRSLLDSYGAMSVGEVVDDPPLPRQKEYVAGADRLHTAYSFYLLQASAATPELFAKALTSWGAADGWPSWSLGNHDVPRFPTRLAHSGDPAQARIILAALICLRGAIFLYQGDELGLPQAQVPFDRLRDPFAIAAFDGGAGRDGARTPMPWTADGPGASFSTCADTWLPIDPAHRALAVDVQEADPASMLHFTRQLIALRRAHPALRLGDATVLPAPPGVLAFTRSTADQTLLCVFELAGRAATYEAPAGAEIAARFGERDVLDGRSPRLQPFGGVVLRTRVAGWDGVLETMNNLGASGDVLDDRQDSPPRERELF
ncbi:MAG: alpha-amylase family glycosyl hydrolase [Pseudomonadota bacterium]|nr:alpha-amylase family glycosyl hydrolase [Pseudomonadota bacterium]